jgi:thiaminase
VNPDELARESARATTRSYSDFLIRTASVVDYDELLACLLPCLKAPETIADAADLDRLREPFLVSSRFGPAFWDMALEARAAAPRQWAPNVTSFSVG